MSKSIYDMYLERAAKINAMEGSYMAEIEVKRTELQAWLVKEQKTCHHKDMREMFYYTCKECGKVVD